MALFNTFARFSESVAFVREHRERKAAALARTQGETGLLPARPFSVSWLSVVVLLITTLLMMRRWLSRQKPLSQKRKLA